MNKMKSELFESRYRFFTLYINRNIRRKMTSDTIMALKHSLIDFQKKKEIRWRLFYTHNQ